MAVFYARAAVATGCGANVVKSFRGVALEIVCFNTETGGARRAAEYCNNTKGSWRRILSATTP
ncbi:MAG: hypothetical protein NTW72_00040, partial [Gemmatimonadetes bacterium]|nr:hypothetical protein [Gemmatimonadota bacterium]